MRNTNTEIIVTLGPACDTKADVAKMKDRGVTFVRVNMSHSSLDYLERCIELSKAVGIPFILDTEGSQVRTGDLEQDVVHVAENEEVGLWSEAIVGDSKNISLSPSYLIGQLSPGDLIHVDFDTLILRVTDVSPIAEGYVVARAVAGGYIGGHKAVVVDPVFTRKFDLPPLSPKDYRSIELGLGAGVEHIAVSFARSAASVKEARRATHGKMKIISKVECMDALENIDEIIDESDYLLIDRGDLAKEVSQERIPFIQKVVIDKARRHNTGVFVATNLLESMVERSKPTRAEVQDIVNTMIDGAEGLILAAETAIGNYPLKCVNTLRKVVDHTEAVLAEHDANLSEVGSSGVGLLQSLDRSGYLVGDLSSSLIPPHGGHLVNRVLTEVPSEGFLSSLPKIRLDQDREMEVEQIAVGTYSPLEGFMGEEDYQSVLSEMRLANGTVWPLPITLDVARDTAEKLSLGQTIGLTNDKDEVVALMELADVFEVDREQASRQLFGTTTSDHPGVRAMNATEDVVLAGKVELIKPRPSPTRSYELSPKQLRRLFDERGWATVLGFHSRNVIHRGHEYVQMRAMQKASCDGMLVQPVVGKKKPGDFKPIHIIRSYETMIERFYPRDHVVCAAFPTYSRYAGPREALFTALCRQNYGCSHFIVGRDHTGVGSYYGPYASQEIFDDFSDIEITIMKFNEVVYSTKHNKYVERATSTTGELEGEVRRVLSGTEAREMFRRGETPPEWFMRPEIAKPIVEAVERGEQVFETAD